LFLTSGNILHLYVTKNADEVSGLLKKNPGTGWLWFLSFISIIGFPPFPIFISEFLMVKEMVAKGYFVPVILFLALLTIIMYGFGKTIFGMLFGKEKECGKKTGLSMILPQVLFLLLLLAIGIYIPHSVYQMIENAAYILVH
jgi:hydrogenase-4 component F